MAQTVSFPKPFQSGFRTINGDDLNSAISSDVVSSANGITAHAGGGQANAFQLFTVISRVTTVANANDSVKLPPAIAGSSAYIDNDGANNLSVYPSGTDQVEDSTSSVSLSPGQDASFVCPVAGKWYQVGSTGGALTATSLALLGATSGTTTIQASAIAGTTTQTLPAVTGTVASTSGANLFIADLKRCTTQVDATSATLANITGLTGQAISVGTYVFRINLYGTCGGTGGWKVAFNYTTAALSAINANALAFTASAVAVSNTTTTTTQTSIIASNTAFTNATITGTMVVSTAGTVDLQFAENSANSTSSIFVGSTMEFIRIA